MNRLVPYLDLFMRLDDAELSRLAGVDADLVATLRRQVIEIGEGLAQYLDLLPRLSDEELIRLTGASSKTIRFWRLCQPKTSPARASDIAARAEISSITPMPTPASSEPAAAPARDDPPTQLRRRTTGVGMQATMLAAGATGAAPVANWSHEASGTNAATTITPPPQQVPIAASWDTSGPASSNATMITPIGQTPDPISQPRVDPSESQQAAARALDINGEPFPGYDWNGELADEDAAFTLSDLDH